MDDGHTKDTLDALADLFLTGAAPAPPKRVPPHLEKHTSQSGSPTSDNTDTPQAQPSVATDANSSHSQSSNKIGDLLDGPAPIPLHPKPSATQEPGYDDIFDDNFDEILNDTMSDTDEPDLRLHRDDDSDDGNDQSVNEDATVDADSEDSIKPVQRLESRFESVFLGNLPGIGGPWLAQYAHHIAKERGPVAVIHAQEDQLSIDLVSSEPLSFDLDVNDVAGATIDQTVGDHVISLLDRFAYDADTPIATWMVHLPTPMATKQTARAAGIGNWAILTGADDMAVAAAHRLLEQINLADTARDTDNANDDERLANRQIGAMIMGDLEPRAQEAIAKINATSASFLKQPIELIGSRKQMLPVQLQHVGEFEGEELWPLVQAYIEELLPQEPAQDVASPSFDDAGIENADEPVAATKTPLVSPPETPFESAIFECDSSVSPDAEVDAETSSDPEITERVPPISTSEPTLTPPIHMEPDVSDNAAAVLNESPAAEFPSDTMMQPNFNPQSPNVESSEQTQDATSNEGDAPNLANLLATSIAGIALDARCPNQVDTQLLLDQQGNLHLLQQHVTDDVAASIIDLMEVRDWVAQHIELIALTQRQCLFNSNSTPTLHLFASDAKQAVGLVQKVGPSVKLHLLQKVSIGSQCTWVCTDLN